MNRRPAKQLPIEAFRKIEGPEILKKLGEARRTLCMSRIPHGTPDKLVANDIISRIDDMAEMITGDRTHFHIKMQS
ncbi:hypothetical protein ACFOYU_11185 [Microvirga sp. GCM10011540]|uniref:hypothetical protein n=1 Tax=Microvirga sp. GCM10011540 TaxID=3317338 RepID=UPI00361AE864